MRIYTTHLVMNFCGECRRKMETAVTDANDGVMRVNMTCKNRKCSAFDKGVAFPMEILDLDEKTQEVTCRNAATGKVL